MLQAPRSWFVLLSMCLAIVLVAWSVWAQTQGKKQMVNTKDKDAAALRSVLTPEQYHVTQECGTEKPFANAYWDNKADGVYVDVVSGEALFSSLDKFDSHSGWPSFTKPLEDNITTRADQTLGQLRTEVRSKGGDSHLGHVFDDGPEPTQKRYCINSAAMRFVPLEKLAAAHLQHYLFAFAEKKGWQIATLAGGCFWGMEELLRKRPGVLATQVGYTGGTTENPSYKAVCTGKTGHAEAAQILFDPKKTSYKELLQFFFTMHDPTTLNKQQNDVGTQYRSAIFYANAAQKAVAEQVCLEVNLSGKWQSPLVTRIEPLKRFWRAEPEHQDYLEKHPMAIRAIGCAHNEWLRRRRMLDSAAHLGRMRCRNG